MTQTMRRVGCSKRIASRGDTFIITRFSACNWQRLTCFRWLIFSSGCHSKKSSWIDFIVAPRSRVGIFSRHFVDAFKCPNRSLLRRRFILWALFLGQIINARKSLNRLILLRRRDWIPMIGVPEIGRRKARFLSADERTLPCLR